MKFINKKNIKLAKRKKSSHKGDNGRLLIIGGSENYVGALSLAGLAALRSGADWVTIAAPEKVAWAVNCLSKDLITIKLKGKYVKKNEKIDSIIKKFDTLLIGNGIGTKKETQNFVKNFIKKNKIKKVIDADAIKAIKLQDCENSILTPHKKELEKLAINSFDKKTLKNFYYKNIFHINNINIKLIQKKLKNNIIIQKGRFDRIITKNKILYNKTGNEGMTKAGTGDVLAGLAAGFLSQTLPLEQSAINAAYYNGLIGDILQKKHKGYTYLASDMVEEIERIIK